MRSVRIFFSRLHRMIDRFPLLFCVCFAFDMTLITEAFNRRQFFGGFVFLFSHPLSFLCNFFLLFLLFSPALFLKRRYAYWTAATSLLLLLCTVQAVLLHYRGFPVMAGDLLSFLSGPDIIFSYVSVPLFCLLLSALLALLVSLFFLVRRFALSTRIQGKQRLLSLILIPCVLLTSLLWVIIPSQSRENPMQAYPGQGLVYSFLRSTFGNTPKKPDHYSLSAVEDAMRRLEAESVAESAPNLLYIQLESFTDFALWKGLTANESPTPFFHSLWESEPHGYLQIDKVGFGTSDTEFEILCGIDLWDVGIASYPYNRFLQKRPCESVATVLSRHGYSSVALHNHAYDFYSRHEVYPNLGFSAFYSVESMEGITYNTQNWAKDAVFASLLPTLLAQTEQQRDFLFSVTVQGHGDYPDGEKNLPITITGADSQEKNERLSYYFSQMQETDRMLQELFSALQNYPEPVTVLLYGDHLPGIGLEADDLTTNSLYHTPYVVWSNYEDTLSPVRYDMEAYEMSAWLLDAVGIHAGTIFRCRQSERATPADLQLFTYDLLSGKQYCMAQTPLSPVADFQYGEALKKQREGAEA